MSVRKFPPPWSVVKTDGAYVVRDANGFRLAYVYVATTKQCDSST